MPVTSKAQHRLMKGIAEGTIPEKGKLTKHKAAEMVGNQSPIGLPERTKALGRLVKRVKSKRFEIG